MVEYSQLGATIPMRSIIPGISFEMPNSRAILEFIMSSAMEPERASMAGAIEAAQIVLPCGDLDDTLAYYTETLGFRVAAISPADNPAVAVLQGHGIRLRLEVGRAGDPGVLRLLCREPWRLARGEMVLTAPNGTRIELEDVDAPLRLPPVQQRYAVSHLDADARWVVGRAGMRYRDLVPDRQGGRFIASHIHIPGGGPVPDYVHFHEVRFQMIYCYRGWVKVVYEAQGEPFVLHAGDCVLQPPRIRHRVIEASPGLEVIEVGCPAEHATVADLDMELPTGDIRPERDFGGQRFVRHIAAEAAWQSWRLPGFEERDTGIGHATGGLAGVRVVRPASAGDRARASHDGELQLWFVLDGTMTVSVAGQPAERLTAGDNVVIPAQVEHALGECSGDLRLLEVTLPARLATSTR